MHTWIVHYLGGYEEPDPGHYDEESGGEVVGVQVLQHVAGQLHLKSLI